MSKPQPVTLTPNQVIAYNLARARRLKGWTQREAAEELAPFLGSRWSKATFSAAERSVDGKVVRQFTGDDLVAFARCFEVPIGWFFMPPRTPNEEGRRLRLATPDVPGGAEWSVLVDLVFGEPSSEPLVGLRLEEYLDDADGREASEGERQAAIAAARRVASLVRAGSDGLDQWRTQLMEIAGHLDNLIGLAGLARLAEPDEANRLSDQAEALAEPQLRHEVAATKPRRRTKTG